MIDVNHDESSLHVVEGLRIHEHLHALVLIRPLQHGLVVRISTYHSDCISIMQYALHFKMLFAYIYLR